MVRNYVLDQKIELLYEMTTSLLDKADKVIKDSVSLDKELDIKLKFREIRKDKSDIEEDVIRFLMTEAPYGRYLRSAITIIKMTSHIKRIAEHALNLFYIKRLDQNEYSYFVSKLKNMALTTSMMMKKSLDAFCHQSNNLEDDIVHLNQDVDTLEKEINEKLCSLDNKELKNLFGIYYMNKEIKRICNHISNMCSWIVFMDTGERPLDAFSLF